MCLIFFRFGLPAESLWVSVFEDDDEAFEIWHKKVSQKELYILLLVQCVYQPCWFVVFDALI